MAAGRQQATPTLPGTSDKLSSHHADAIHFYYRVRPSRFAGTVILPRLPMYFLHFFFDLAAGFADRLIAVTVSNSRKIASLRTGALFATR